MFLFLSPNRLHHRRLLQHLEQRVLRFQRHGAGLAHDGDAGTGTHRPQRQALEQRAAFFHADGLLALDVGVDGLRRAAGLGRTSPPCVFLLRRGRPSPHGREAAPGWVGVGRGCRGLGFGLASTTD